MNVDYVPVANLTNAAEMIARQKEIRRRQEEAAQKIKVGRATRSAMEASPAPVKQDASEAPDPPPPPEGYEKDPAYIISAVARAFDVERRSIINGSLSPLAYQARRFAIAAIKEANPLMTGRQVGAALGGLDPSCVNRAIRINERDGLPCPVNSYVVSPHVEPIPIRTSARKVIAQVADQFALSPSDIIGQGRSRDLIMARFAAVYAVAIARPDLSLPAIGRAFGGRDHTTILHALRSVKRDGVPQPDGTRVKSGAEVAQDRTGSFGKGAA